MTLIQDCRHCGMRIEWNADIGVKGMWMNYQLQTPHRCDPVDKEKFKNMPHQPTPEEIERNSFRTRFLRNMPLTDEQRATRDRYIEQEMENSMQEYDIDKHEMPPDLFILERLKISKLGNVYPVYERNPKWHDERGYFVWK